MVKLFLSLAVASIVVCACNGVLPINLCGSDQALQLQISGAQAARNEPSNLRTAGSEPLLRRQAGDVDEALAGLEGCWAAVYDLGTFQGADFYRFETSENSLTYEVLTEDSAFCTRIALRHEYELVTVGADSVIIRLTAVESESNLMQGVREISGDGQEFKLFVIRSGNSFVIAAGGDASDNFEGAHRAGIVFRRVACP